MRWQRTGYPRSQIAVRQSEIPRFGRRGTQQKLQLRSFEFGGGDLRREPLSSDRRQLPEVRRAVRRSETSGAIGSDRKRCRAVRPPERNGAREYRPGDNDSKFALRCGLSRTQAARRRHVPIKATPATACNGIGIGFGSTQRPRVATNLCKVMTGPSTDGPRGPR